jgi:hypothetical protein
MRTFRDGSGITWTVFEVRRQVQGGTKGDWSYLPSGFSDGWLCFESPSAKKRLVRYPQRWREFGDDELERLLNDAAPAPRASMSASDDLGDTPASPDVRAD